MKSELNHKKNKFPFSPENIPNPQSDIKNSNYNPFKNNIIKSRINSTTKRIKPRSAKNKKLILSPKLQAIVNSELKDDLNINADSNYIKTLNSEKQSIYDNVKYNLKTLKTETKDKSIFDKKYMNNLSVYSTLWYTEEPKYQKTYYTLNNKRKEKMFRDVLKKSENFNKFNDDRLIIGIINKFKNKNIAASEFKKFQQFTYKKRIPIKIAFGLGQSNNEAPVINNNRDFNKRLKQQKIIKVPISKRLNTLYKKGFYDESEKGLSKNYNKENSKSSPKKLFVVDSSKNKLYPKDSFGNEIYSVFTKHKILRNILPKEVDYNTKTSIEDILNSEIHPLLRHQKKVLVNSTNLISQELNVLMGHYLRLCQKKKETGDKGEDVVVDMNKKFIELMKCIIKEKEKEEEKKHISKSEEEHLKKMERRKYLLNKFKDVIILAYKKIKKFNIDMNIFYSLMDYNKNDPQFQMELILNGQYLFKAIKAGDIPEIIKFIDQNKYLVAYKDNFNQIPLHICAKRNLYQLIHFLLSRLSSLDFQDLGGRTPLMIAAKNNFFEFVTILLFEGADPNIKDVYGHSAAQMTTNDKLRMVLRRAQILHNLKYFIRGKDFEDFIFNGLDYLFKRELEMDYEDWINEGEKILKDIS